MSAVETIREAARLMRERATGATKGSWIAQPLLADSGSDHLAVLGGEREYTYTFNNVVVDRPVVAIAMQGDRADAEHIAGMDPTVAIAVADWLDVVYYMDLDGEGPGTTNAEFDAALAAARTYLRSES